MNTLEFAAEVIFVSASGVLFPGPLFFANLIYGSKQGFHAGIKIAFGHTVVEFPLVILLALGLFRFSPFILTNDSLRVIGLVGGFAIILFSIAQISNIMRTRRIGNINNNSKPFFRINNNERREKEPFVLGIIFSALNPFFLVWWFTVGLKLISDSIYLFGVIAGILFIFSFHIWMDYAWLGVTSYMISKGRSILKTKLYNLLLFSVSIVLTSYGLYLLVVNIF